MDAAALGNAGQAGESIILLDSAEAELAALLGHPDEVFQTLAKFCGPPPCPLNERDPYALVALGELAEVFPGRLVGFDCPKDVRRHCRFLAQRIAQRGEHLPGDLAVGYEIPEALLVRLRIAALRLPRRESLCEPLFIQFLDRAVYPAEA